MAKKKQEEKFEMLTVEEAHDRIMACPLVASYEVFKNPRRWKVAERRFHIARIEPDKTHGDEYGILIQNYRCEAFLPNDDDANTRHYGAVRGVFGSDLATIMSKAVNHLDKCEAERLEREKVEEEMLQKQLESADALRKEHPEEAEAIEAWVAQMRGEIVENE